MTDTIDDHCSCRDCETHVARTHRDQHVLCDPCSVAGCDDGATGRLPCELIDYRRPKVHEAGSGYTQCACRDCFEQTVSDNMALPDLCSDCKEAGCDDTGASECLRDDAYGTQDEAYEDIVNKKTTPELTAKRKALVASGNEKLLDEFDVMYPGVKDD